MKLHIQITDGKVKIAIKALIQKEGWSFNRLGKEAILFYVKARKFLKE